MIETDTWPLVRAKWFTDVPKSTPRRVRVGVVHDMEYSVKLTAAEEVARYFQDPRDERGNPVKASAHVCCDANSIVQCVSDSDVAYAAPGCNNDGIQIELAGYGRFTREQWLAPGTIEVVWMGALAMAQYCLKFDLPVCHLTNAQLKSGEKGIIGHYQASEVYHLSDHTDPGPGFPWDVFMDRVAMKYAERRARLGT